MWSRSFHQRSRHAQNSNIRALSPQNLRTAAFQGWIGRGLLLIVISTNQMVHRNPFSLLIVLENLKCQAAYLPCVDTFLCEQFPVGRIHRHLKTRVSRHGRVGATSAVYMAAICEYREFPGRAEVSQNLSPGHHRCFSQGETCQGCRCHCFVIVACPFLIVFLSSRSISEMDMTAIVG